MNSTAIDKVYTALVKDKQYLTAKQIAARFNLVNPHDTVYTLRQEGFPINMKKHIDTKGRMTNKYHLGTPSREVIAAGYKALAAGLV